VAAVVRTIEREVEDATGLPRSCYDVLLELDAADQGRLRMQELGARVVLSRTRVSRLVDEIARTGIEALCLPSHLDLRPDWFGDEGHRATSALSADEP
jgi:hypothetical protein